MISPPISSVGESDLPRRTHNNDHFPFSISHFSFFIGRARLMVSDAVSSISALVWELTTIQN